MKKISRGFTFVELMVVIAIAAIMFSVATVSFTGITKNSRDARRKSDMESIRQALELCRSYTGTYPANINGPTLTCGGQTYMQSIPVDPKDNATPYTYVSTGTTYTLSTTKMENITGCPPNCTYSITNP